MKINLLHIIGFFVGFIFMMFLAFIMQSCTTTKYVSVIEQRDSIVVRIDTTIIKDSVYIATYAKGDTVYIDKYKWNYIEKITRDTIVTNKEIPVIQEVETIKETVPNWCWWLLAVVIVFVVYKLVRLGIKIYTKIQSGGLL